MAKYLRQSPKAAAKKGNKKGGKKLALAMGIYAVLFLILAAIGLSWFWGFIEAYEASRPKVAIDSYMNQVTKAYICDKSGDLIAQVDHNLQSEEDCRAYILDFLSGEITYAKKSSECTDTKQVYVLRTAGKVIGSFTMTTTGADEYGFTPWTVTEDSFDLSFLLGTSASIVAPKDYPVYANGVLLSGDYVTESEEIPFDVFEEFYGNYDLPVFTKLTYEAGPILGEVHLSVTDPDGASFTLDDNTDLNAFVDNCTQQEIDDIDGFTTEFIKRYVIFSGSVNDSRYANYDSLSQMMVKDSSFARRMWEAIEGLHYAQSQGDTITDIQIHHYVNMGDNRYLCDVTYLVDTKGWEGVVTTTNNAKIIILVTESGMKAETMISY